MKKLMSLMLGLAFIGGTVALATMPHHPDAVKKTVKAKKTVVKRP